MDTQNRIDVEYVARLARLELAPEAVAKLQKDMQAILDYIAELAEVDVSGVEPMLHATTLTNVWRDDVVENLPGRDIMLDNAPALINGDLWKVPKVLPGEGSN